MSVCTVPGSNRVRDTYSDGSDPCWRFAVILPRGMFGLVQVEVDEEKAGMAMEVM
jgi:hypothetical protein